jgi:hypothetical protein
MSTTGASWTSGPSGARRPRPLSAVGRVAAPVVALVLLTILPPAVAVAQVRDPAVDQYVESVPGAGGGDGTSEGGSPRDGSGLPPRVQSRIESRGGDDAAALEAVGTSPALGAPKRAPKNETRIGSPGGSKSTPSALDAIASAASGDGSSGGWLLAGLAVLTAALGGMALARRLLTR